MSERHAWGLIVALSLIGLLSPGTPNARACDPSEWARADFEAGKGNSLPAHRDADLSAGGAAASPASAEAAPAVQATGTPVFSTFAGSVEIVDIKVSVGDTVTEGMTVAAVEAMKAQHDIKSPCAGKVTAVHVKIGDEIDSSKPILSIA